MFYGCKSLKRAVLNEGLGKLDINAFEESGVEEVVLPSTLKTLKSYTFHNCYNLKKLVLPLGLEYIDFDCFYTSGLKEILLPATLKQTDRRAFRMARRLKTVYVEEGCAADLGGLIRVSVETVPRRQAEEQSK